LQLSYTPAELPQDEAWRLQSLRDLNVLDTAPEAEFDALVKVASIVCGVPISLISLVDADRQWFKADVGLGAVQTPRDVAFCAHAILGDQIFEVEDALLDERFAGSPLVQGAPDIRFYAGAPITLANGARVGTLCVIDREPKKLTAMQREILQNLGIAASQALEARRILGTERNQAVLAAHDDAVEKARITQLKLESALQQASALASAVDIHAIVSEVDRNGVITNCNDSFERISGYTRDELVGQNHRIVNSGYHPHNFWTEMWQTISAGTAWRGEICNRAKNGQMYWVDSMIAPFIGDDGFVEKYISIRTDITERVMAQRKLDEISLRMNLAIEGGNDGLWDWPDVHQEAQWWSPSYYAILGYSDSELPPSRNSYLSIVHPDFAKISRKANLEAIAGKRLMDLEVQLKTKDRGYRWFRVRAKAGLDAQGIATRMAGSTQDVHERKMAEAALIGNKLLLEESQTVAKVGGWELNLRTGVLFWTNETYRIHETSPSVFNPTVDAGVDLFLPDSKRIISEALEAATSRGESYDLELETYTTRGRLIDVRTTCTVTMEDGKAVKLTGIFQDITERKRYERELQNAKNRIELATQSGGIGIWVYDVVQNTLQWDDRMYALYGLTKQSYLEPYNVWSDCVHPDDRAASEKSLQEALEGKREFDTEFRIVWADQSTHYIRGTARVERDKAGQPLRMVGVNFDITNQKEQASALRAAKDLAEELAKSKGQFLANMSHEIRTPMNAILGLLDLLQSTELTDRQRDYASKTDGAARSLLGLLNDILDFSKVEAGKMTLESEPFRIDKLLRDLSTILSSNVGSKDIEVLFDIDATLPAVIRGDAMRLQQVLINLGGNAVKFTSKGQVVLAMNKLSQQENSVTIQFAVQDTGIGIAPEHQVHIFSGFSQAEGSTTRKFGGTGLGLAISKRFVELMGGDIEITSAPGVGSTFAFALEMPTVEVGTEILAEPDRPSVAPQRVLVVDDNPIAGELTLRLVRSWGWPADLAKSGKQALEMVAAQGSTADAGFPYPVIYMDWKMPDMDGWEATRRIREWAQVANAPQPMVVMMTAHGRETLALRTEAEQDLINGFLVKPVTASMLYEALMEASSGNASIRKIAKGRSNARQLIGMRILVVEDNLINQKVADELLTAQGAIVSLAANGQLGVDAVAAAAPQFDVVLMDVQMPVLDGYGATRAIRNELGLKDLPIVAMTANAMASDRDACLAAGMNEHIGKPFDMVKLVSLLIRMTGLQPLAATSDDPAVALPQQPTVPEIAGLELQTALNRMSGMQSLYVRTARDFVRIMDTVIPELQQYLGAGDQQKTIMCLHTLKGNAGTLGATELSAMAAKLEKLCATGAGMQECRDGLGQLEAMVHSTRRALSVAITELDSPSATGRSVVEKATGQPLSQAALSALRRIADMANASDMEALQEFAQARELLAELPVESMEALDLAVQNLDLELAGVLCDQMLSGLRP
jgi:two-component system sensor histidine kinase/response regulator